MAKLRVVRERKDAVENSRTADLRGFEDQELFNKSGMDAHLVVAHVDDQHQMESLAEAYGLTVQHLDSHPGMLHFQVARSAPGEHKKNGLRLFFAALELHRKSPHAHCAIFQTSGLHDLIRDRLEYRGSKTSHQFENLLSHAIKSPFSIHLPVMMTLQQADMLPSSHHVQEGIEWHHLDGGQIQAVHQHLNSHEEVAETRQRQRKAV